MAEGAPVQISAIRGRSCLRAQGTHPFTADPLVSVKRDASPLRVLGIGPGDWLILSQELGPAALRARIEAELAQPGFVLVDQSDGLSALEVRGSAARQLLSKGCGLDLHPESFPAGHCARTRFAQIPVVIECLDGPPRFELTVARSYLQFLRSWLEDAAVEFESTPA